MRVIELDADGWTTTLDFQHALRCAIGAPECHGWTCDAFVASMTGSGTNSLKPPYTIRIFGTAAIASEIRTEIETLAQALKDAHIWRRNHRHDDFEVTLEIAP